MAKFTDDESTYEYARGQWESGADRMHRFSSDSRRRAVVENVVEGIMVELERRIGQTFTTGELIELSHTAERWCMEVAHELAPEDPWAWDLDVVQNTAFHRFVRRASDYTP